MNTGFEPASAGTPPACLPLVGGVIAVRSCNDATRLAAVPVQKSRDATLRAYGGPPGSGMATAIPPVDGPHTRLDVAVSYLPAHLLGPHCVVRQRGVSLALPGQRSGPVRLPTDKRFVAVINGDTETFLRPSELDGTTVRVFAGRYRPSLVVTCEPSLSLHQAVTGAASAFRKDVRPVKSQSRQEFDRLAPLLNEGATTPAIVDGIPPPTDALH